VFKNFVAEMSGIKNIEKILKQTETPQTRGRHKTGSSAECPKKTKLVQDL
jgi:hypothetical protein